MALILVAALAFHVAEVGLIGLLIIVLATAFTGIVEEHRLGEAFHEALPFTALVVVFFAIVSFIEAQDLFRPVMEGVLALQGAAQLAMFYLANGALSAISDNVFVATIFIEEIEQAAAGRPADARAVRRAGGRAQHRRQHSEHRHAERPGCVPLSAELLARAADPPVLRADGMDGACRTSWS